MLLVKQIHLLKKINFEEHDKIPTNVHVSFVINYAQAHNCLTSLVKKKRQTSKCHYLIYLLNLKSTVLVFLAQFSSHHILACISSNLFRLHHTYKETKNDFITMTQCLNCLHQTMTKLKPSNQNLIHRP